MSLRFEKKKSLLLLVPYPRRIRLFRNTLNIRTNLYSVRQSCTGGERMRRGGLTTSKTVGFRILGFGNRSWKEIGRRTLEGGRPSAVGGGWRFKTCCYCYFLVLVWGEVLPGRFNAFYWKVLRCGFFSDRKGAKRRDFDQWKGFDRSLICFNVIDIFLQEIKPI